MRVTQSGARQVQILHWAGCPTGEVCNVEVSFCQLSIPYNPEDPHILTTYVFKHKNNLVIFNNSENCIFYCMRASLPDLSVGSPDAAGDGPHTQLLRFLPQKDHSPVLQLLDLLHLPLPACLSTAGSWLYHCPWTLVLSSSMSPEFTHNEETAKIPNWVCRQLSPRAMWTLSHWKLSPSVLSCEAGKLCYHFTGLHWKLYGVIQVKLWTGLPETSWWILSGLVRISEEDFPLVLLTPSNSYHSVWRFWSVSLFGLDILHVFSWLFFSKLYYLSIIISGYKWRNSLTDKKQALKYKAIMGDTKLKSTVWFSVSI